ncbi:hypothetical protein EG329_012121 [Mollisiaceae sp. DMI_Dod_QoI]|nr:hypothetical protein EG329_012121 [Helotiales sp. DMI_Dod_QoI]
MLATNTSANGGKSILLNPGGPGGSGISSLWASGERLNKIIGEGFHLLSFDPRGVNGSIPQALCYASTGQRSEQTETNPWNLEFEAGEMFTRAENKGKACTDIMGEHGAYVDTPQTAADMNSILDAIGQEEMYYWGFSYGTTLGQTYAQMFPDRVGRLVIDGVINLDEWYNAFFFQEWLTDTDNVYAGFFRECFKAKENCALNSIKDTPFASAADLQSHVDDFLLRLEEEPIPVYLTNSNYGAITRIKIVLNAIFPALYRPSPQWPTLAKNLAELLKGNATPAFNAYSETWFANFTVDDTNTFVMANDCWKAGKGAPVHGVKPIQNFTLSLPQDSRLISRYQGSDVYGRASWPITTTHKFHPRYHPEYPKVKTAFPILVLSTTYDPVCPLASAKKAHNSFEGAGLVEQKSYGHCTMSMPSLCKAKHVKSYFYEGKLPEDGTTCEIDTEYFPAQEKSAFSELKFLDRGDAELLVSLQELASAELIKHHPFLRGPYI